MMHRKEKLKRGLAADEWRCMTKYRNVKEERIEGRLYGSFLESSSRTTTVTQKNYPAPPIIFHFFNPGLMNCFHPLPSARVTLQVVRPVPPSWAAIRAAGLRPPPFSRQRMVSFDHIAMTTYLAEIIRS